jgi:L-rhamnose isomerase
MAKEIVRCDALDRVYMALDYFDASINRIASWAIGMRSWQKALLNAMLTPNAMLKQLQDESKLTQLIVAQEQVKTLPFGDIWREYCVRCGVPTECKLWGEIETYENEVLAKRV